MQLSHSLPCLTLFCLNLSQGEIPMRWHVKSSCPLRHLISVLPLSFKQRVEVRQPARDSTKRVFICFLTCFRLISYHSILVQFDHSPDSHTHRCPETHWTKERAMAGIIQQVQMERQTVNVRMPPDQNYIFLIIRRARGRCPCALTPPICSRETYIGSAYTPLERWT
jgi:hypothetical protein